MRIRDVAVSVIIAFPCGQERKYLFLNKNGYSSFSHLPFNTPCLPPKILCKASSFLLGRLSYPGGIKKIKDYAKFWGQTRCFMGNGQMANVLTGP